MKAKRNIKDITNKDCLLIRNYGEAKKISKLLDKHKIRNYALEGWERMGVEYLIRPLSDHQWGGTQSILKLGATITPASDFLPKKSSFKKQVKKQLASLDNRLRELEVKGMPVRIEPEFENVELKELPEKWLITITEENRESIIKWFNGGNEFAYSIGGKYGMFGNLKVS